MKKLLLIGLAVVAFSGFAQATPCVRPYVSAKATATRLNMNGRFEPANNLRIAKKDWVGGGSAAAGLKMCAFRTELEYNQSLKATYKFDNGAEGVKSRESYRSYMLNGYFDIPTYTPVRPYVGAGIGTARVRTTVERGTNLAWQLASGIGYTFAPDWVLDVGYRYFDNGNIKWNGLKYESKGHQATAGVRYMF